MLRRLFRGKSPVHEGFNSNIMPKLHALSPFSLPADKMAKPCCMKISKDEEAKRAIELRTPLAWLVMYDSDKKDKVRNGLHKAKALTADGLAFLTLVRDELAEVVRCKKEVYDAILAKVKNFTSQMVPGVDVADSSELIRFTITRLLQKKKMTESPLVDSPTRKDVALTHVEVILQSDALLGLKRARPHSVFIDKNGRLYISRFGVFEALTDLKRQGVYIALAAKGV